MAKTKTCGLHELAHYKDSAFILIYNGSGNAEQLKRTQKVRCSSMLS